MRRSNLAAARFLLSLLAAMALLPVGDARGQVAEGSESGGYTVRGIVTNSLTHQGIGRALVTLNQDEAVLTGSGGEFSFENVAAGPYRVSVQKPGYSGFGSPGVVGSGRTFLRPTEPPRQIQVGPEMLALTFALAPLGVITGTVTLSTADSPDGIAVVLYRRQVREGRSRWEMAGRTKTRSNGRFRFAGLPPGSYMAYTEASLDDPAQAADSRTPVWGFPGVYYPGVTDISGAGVLSLGTGQQAEADFTLTRQRFFPVTAVVEGGSAQSANFEILDSGGRPSGISPRFDRQNQVAHAAVPNGSWSMTVRGFGRRMQWGRTDFQVSGAPVSFAISAQTVSRIPVEIRREFVSTANASEPSPPEPGVYLTLESADDFSIGGNGNLRRSEGATDGASAELEVSQPGRYWVEGDAFPPAYISSITSGGVDLMSNPLVIAAGSQPAPVEITLRNDAGNIGGQVTGLGSTAGMQTAAARPNVWVYAIPLFPSIARLQDTMPNPSGQFTFYNLAPGSYRVVACDSPQEIDFHAPEGLAAWAGKGQTVTVEAGGTASVQVDVVSTEGTP